MATSAPTAFFLCFLITSATFHVCFCNNNNITCFENEREALLKFKQDLKDPSNRLSSWDTVEDCCRWAGVVCDNLTGHVHQIRLQNPYNEFETEIEYQTYLRNELGGKVNPSLLDLKHLQYLDLSNNDFEGTPIPSFIGSIATLRYLNLSRAGFGGTVPPQLGNLTKIRYIGLTGGSNYHNGTEALALCNDGSLQWLSGLVSLQHLQMSKVNLSDASDWVQVTSNLPSLVELHLSGCELKYVVSPSLTNKINFTTLDILDLSSNHLGPSIPGWIFGLNNLLSLDLSYCRFSSPIPSGLQNLTSLRVLDLSSNSFNSTMPIWLQGTSNLPSLVELHLSGCEPKYVVSPSLTNKINFTTLNVLDLSRNDLGPSIPGWIPGLNDLVSLDLSECRFSGPFPSGLQNMTSLRVLDLFVNHFNSTIPNWLYSLTHLESLDLGGNQLQGEISIAIENWTSLVSLHLWGNQLQGSIPTSLGKLCNLKTINLSDNKFSGEVSDVLVGFSRCKCPMLEDFYFGVNNLVGHLPDELGQLKNLNTFFISHNSFSGPIPVSIGRLSSLKELHLSYNKFNGTIPESFGQLAKLEYLVLTNNTLEGVVSDVHFANLTRLRYLYARGNNLTFKASENWVPPFEVEALDLSSWQLGPLFPLWLSSQRTLTYLNIASTRISGSIPALFWPIFSRLSYANLSRNHFCGEIPSLSNERHSLVDLSSNCFNGSLPLVPSNLTWLDLSNNSFSGSIHHVLCGKGEEPNKTLSFLNLGNNLLSGNIPECWKHWPDLFFIILENNNLVGGIPSSIGQLPYLRSLHLRHNNLSGELPPTLQNCSSLRILDLSENRFTGSIPPWMGNAFFDLVVLNLRSNYFWGNLPYELCHLRSLQILDIACNNILGHVPRCFANFSGMAEIKGNLYNGGNLHFGNISNSANAEQFQFQDNAFLVAKGREVEYSTTLELVKSMDLSGNKLSGEIPEELTKLVGLWSLNLSCNHLTGRIPRNIGDMRQLESVDFSLNQLSGVIPSSMSSLSFLSHLNLSYNNLTGPIPSSTQLQTMTESSFLGNKLCGPPLPSCNLNKTIPPNIVPHGSDEEREGFSEALFIASIALGFAVGFWVVLGPLLFKRSWRIAYFRVIEDMWNKVCDFSFECRYRVCK